MQSKLQSESNTRLAARIDGLAVGHKIQADMLMSLDHNIDKLTVDVQRLLKNSAHDGENIRALARIAVAHQDRISALEGETPPA